jgi:uroporphyrinogen-III decarboxylase
MSEYNYYINHEQVQKSHERLKSAYRREDTDHIPIVQMTSVQLGYSIFDIVYKKEAMLKHQLANITTTMRHKTDYCPMLAPWHGVGMYAELFGCNIRWFENDWPWVKPIIYDNPMDVYKLKPKKLDESDLWKHLFETIDFFQLNTKGDIPITTTDPQGPMATASMIWRTEDLMCACYTNPKEVHYLLNLVTDTFIEFYEKQLKVIENPAYPGWGFPLGEKGMGISISDDNAAFMSPELYEEFCVPYNERISKHFNGLYLHSCGDWTHNIKPALKIDKLRAVNYHTVPAEGDAEVYRKNIGDKCSIWTGVTDADAGFKGNKPEPRELYRDYLLPKNLNYSKTGIIISGLGDYVGTDAAPEEMNEFYDFLVAESNKYSQYNSNLLNVID